MDIKEIWDSWNDERAFSGVFSVMDESGTVFEKNRGFRNRSEALPNMMDTAFGIASGTKMFTGLAICKLIDARGISLEDKLWDILPYGLGQIDKRVSIEHLLTHTSGIGDYIDEESPDSVEQLRTLYARFPVYLWEKLSYYLQMILPLPPKFEPGARFGYSNADYIMLGLVVEAISGKTFQQFVRDEIVLPLHLAHTGFYRTDALPANTAFGYTKDAKSGQLRSNLFSIPVLGGSDGGLYTCAADLDRVWRALFAGRLLSENMLQAFLHSHVQRDERRSYGLGVYRYETRQDTAYYAVGSDFGVEFFTAYFPKYKITASAMGNTETATYPLLSAMFSNILE